jgi:DNA-binding CsgD family transcriptional regulator
MAVALREADVAGMLEVLHEAAVVDGPDAFTEPVVDALMRLLPVDAGACCNVCAGHDLRIPAEQLSIVDFASCGAEWIRYGPNLWTEEMTETVFLYGREEESVPPTPELMVRAVRESDVLSYREMRKRHIWWEVDRHFGNDNLSIWLPAPEEGVMRQLHFSTLERRTIPDRYVQILQLLAPHFVVLYRRAAARRVRVTSSLVSPRELEILALVGGGKTNKEIARELWLSPHTVRSHLENAFEKLEVRTRTAAVARVFGDPAAPERVVPPRPSGIKPGW